MSIHWSQLDPKLLERLDRVRVREIKRGAKVLSYEPGRFLTTKRAGQKVTHRLDENGRVRVIK